MDIFICTFFFKLNCVKVKQNKRETKSFNTSLTALLKSATQQVIAISPKKPVVINGTAWFSQKFEIKSDIACDSVTKKSKQSIIILEIIRQFQNIKTYHKIPINLANVFEKKTIPEMLYKLDGGGGVQASFELSCFQNINETVTIAKINNNKTKKVSKKETFQRKPSQEIRNSAQSSRVDSNHTPSFGLNSQHYQLSSLNFQQMQVIYETKLSRHNSQESPQVANNEQIKKLELQLQQQRQKTKKCKDKINSMSKTQINNNTKIQSLLSQLDQSQNLNNILTANISNKQTQLVQLKLQLESIQETQKQIDKKKSKYSVQTLKAHHQKQITTLSNDLNELKKNYEESQHMLEIYKAQLNKHINLCNQYVMEMDNQRRQTQTIVKQLRQYKQKIKKHDKEILTLKQTISKSQKETEDIRNQNSDLRIQFANGQKKRQQQSLILQQRYEQLFNRYSQMLDNQHGKQTLVSKALYIQQVQFYEQKIRQYEQKQQTLRKQISIVEQEMSNTYEILEQKDQRQEILVQHIKKLQDQLQVYKRQRQFWGNVIPRQSNQEAKESNQEVGQSNMINGHSQDIKKLQEKNSQLLKMLKTYSKGILQTQRLNKEISLTKKRYSDLQQKVKVLSEESKQLKDRISILLKQNKKLLDKNHKISRVNQLQASKIKRMQDELKLLKIQHKQMKSDYNIISQHMKHSKRDRIPFIDHQETPRSASKSPRNRPKKIQTMSPSASKRQSKTQHSTIVQKCEIYMQNLSKLLSQRKIQNENLNQLLSKLLQQKYNQKKLNLQKQLKNIDLLMSKLKRNVAKSGNYKLIGDLQISIKKISSQFQNMIIKI